MHAPRMPIAIVGIACRLPGGANDADALWALLCEGRDATRAVPPGRWRALPPDTPAHGGFIDGVDLFDAELFSISRREAEQMDPQQRLLLMAAWEAMEDACVSPAALARTRTGVFVGISNVDYHRMLFRDTARLTPHSGTGTALSVAAARISYVFDLKGPSLAIDTACSSSLVALHYACRSLREGECERALVAGVSLMLNEEVSAAHARSRMLAPDGRCKPFDAAADGFGRGEGCAMLMLRRLDDALAGGDRVLAVVLGSAVNHDGLSNGLTAPNSLAQQEVIGLALRDAGIAPQDVGYVEAHGTGTPLGDPLEMRGLHAAYVDPCPERAPLWVGSVKANMGHLEAAAGAAGLLKAALMVQRGAIPPLAQLRELNPRVDLAEGRIRLPRAAEPWAPPAGARRIAGVSAFSFGGTNCHVLLAQPPAVRAPAPAQVAGDAGGRHALQLAARTPDALRAMARAWHAALHALPDADLADFCAATSRTRARLPESATLTGDGRAALLAALDALAQGTEHPGLRRSSALPPRMDGNAGGRWMALPRYPFQLARYWFEEPVADTGTMPEAAWHRIVWEPWTPPAASTGATAWLLLGDAVDAAGELAHVLRRQGHAVHHVPAGTLDTLPPDAAQALARWLAGLDAPRLNVLHAAAPLAQAWNTLAPEAVAGAVERALADWLVTCRHAMATLRARPLRLWCVTQHATGRRGMGAADPAGAALAGAARTLRLEQPALWGGWIDLDATSPAALEAAARVLLARDASPTEDQHAIAADGAAWVPRLRPAAEPATDLRAGARAPLLRGDRSYLVTGGLGGIGRQLAHWLLERGAGHVVTLGRGPADGAPLPADRWTHVRGSVADASALDACLAAIGRTLPPLAGVFHAAGVMGDGMPIERLDAAAIHAALAPKLHGALQLHRALAALPQPPFLALFSSIASVWGSASQGAYAAANAAMDALAATAMQGGQRIVAVHWGPWAGAGMAADPERLRLLEARGVLPLAPAEAFAALERALAAPQWQTSARARIDWRRFVPSFAAVGADALFRALAAPASISAPRQADGLPRGHLRAELLRAAAPRRLRLLEDFAAGAIRAVLKLPADAPLDGERGFAELGMDSLMALELRQRLEAALDLEIASTVAFDHPSLRRLAQHLLERMAGPVPAPAAPAAPVKTPAPAAAAQPAADLSEEELESMLLARLEAIGD